MVGFAALAALAVWSRVSALNAGLWHDEVFSITHYTSLGPKAILGGPYVPNDHALFNLLNWLTVKVAGRADAVYRVWSVFPGLAALVLVTWWARRRFGTSVALVCAGLLVTSPLHLALTRQARGYGLAFFAAASLLGASDWAARDPRRPAAWLALGVSALVGICTLPVFVLPFLGSAVALAVVRERRRAALIVVAAVGVASLAFYSSILGDLLSSSSQQFGAPLPWHGFVTGPVNDLGTPTGQLLARTGSWPDGDTFLAVPALAVVVRLLLGAAALAGAFSLWRHRERDLAALLVLPVLGSYLVLTVARVYVEPRFGSYLAIPYMTLASVGLVDGAAALGRSAQLKTAMVAATAAVGLFACFRLVQHTRYENRSPIENFKGAAAVVKRTGVSSVVTNDARQTGLPYYLAPVTEKAIPAAFLVATFCNAKPPLVYVDAPYSTTEPSTQCLVRRGARHVRLLQQERGGHLDVWILR